MKNILQIGFLICFSVLNVQAQKVSLDSCITQALGYQKYQIQHGQLTETAHLADESISKAWLPSLELQAQATYQNEQIGLPISMPNMEVPEVPLDNYKALFVVQQQIYDGGMTTIRRNMEALNYSKESIELEQKEFGLKSKVAALYFGILLARENKAIIANNQKILKTRIEQIEGAYEAGAALKSQVLSLQAELYSLEQKASEIFYTEKAMRDQLSTLCGNILEESTAFEMPYFELDLADESVALRPEIKLFQNRIEHLSFAQEMEKSKLLPKLGASANLGYGNPGFNVFNDGWSPMAYVGLSLKWNFWDWNRSKSNRQIMTIRQEMLLQEKERVEVSLVSDLKRLKNEMLKNEAYLQSDHKIVNLRKEVVEKAAAQLENGVITSTEYLTELNKSTNAQMQKAVHEIQLHLQQLNFLLLKGTY